MEKTVSEGNRASLVAQVGSLSPIMYKMLLASKNSGELDAMFNLVDEKIAELKVLNVGTDGAIYNGLQDNRKNAYEKYVSYANMYKEICDPAALKTFEIDVAYANSDFAKDVTGYAEASFKDQNEINHYIAKALQSSPDIVECHKYELEARKSLQLEKTK